jgi:hypothetical protein
VRLRAFVEGAVGEKPSDRGRGWLDLGPELGRYGYGAGTVRGPERPRLPDDLITGVRVRVRVRVRFGLGSVSGPSLTLTLTLTLISRVASYADAGGGGLTPTPTP